MKASEINKLQNNKIQSITMQVARYGVSTLLKVFKDNTNIIVVTREGLMKYLGNAEFSFYYGKKNIDYKIFKNSVLASKYIKSELNNYKF